jgi:hypothetical protein
MFDDLWERWEASEPQGDRLTDYEVRVEQGVQALRAALYAALAVVVLVVVW